MCSRKRSVGGWVGEVETGRWGEVEVEGWEIVAVEGGSDTEEGGIVVEIVLVVLESVEVVGCTD